jgi:hypothetical protein
MGVGALSTLISGEALAIGATGIEGPAAYGLNAASGAIGVLGGAMDPGAPYGFAAP